MYFLQRIRIALVILVILEVQVVLSGPRPLPKGKPENHGKPKPKPSGLQGKKGSFNSILQANQAVSFSSGQNQLFQGDVVITEELSNALQNSNTDSIILPGKRRFSRALSSVVHHKWPLVDGAAEIPYTIEPSSEGDGSLIDKAISHWMDNVPCIRFVPRTIQQDYISFFKGQGCYSYVGRVGGGQRISIGEGCENMGIIAHEIGHALGFWHEQSRPDRDSYVRIIWKNIQFGEEYNFKKIINGGTDDLGVPYDFNSLMHYGPTDFAKGPGLNTITSLDGSTNFGDAAVLSPKDIEQARLMYCPGTTACFELYDDSSPNCPSWAALGYCDNLKHKSYMMKNCKKSCVCRGCEDTNPECPYYVEGGFCNHPAVRVVCRKGCKLCY